MNVIKSLALTVTLIISTSSSVLAENVELVKATRNAYCQIASISVSNAWQDEELSESVYEQAQNCINLEIYARSLTVPVHFTPVRAKKYMDAVKMLAYGSNPINAWKLRNNEKARLAHRVAISKLTELVFELSGD